MSAQNATLQHYGERSLLCKKFAVTYLNIFTCGISVLFAPSSSTIIHLVSHTSCTILKKSIRRSHSNGKNKKLLLANEMD